MVSRKRNAGRRGVQRVFRSRDQTRRYYDKISKVYDLLAEESEEPIRRAGLKTLAPKPGEKLLEIGFGTGHCLAAIAAAVGPTGRAFGIDISEGMRHQAQMILRRDGMGQRAEIACGDAISLPYATEVFDGVFMSFTLELFDTPEIPRVLAECERVLRPGGRIVVVGMSREPEETLLMRAFEWTHEHFPNFVDCRPIFVRRSLEAAGFAIRHAEVRQMWLPVEIVLGVKA
jgi:ubiquinone/menaquinone biosynthesis C-methylase UbiE